MKKSFIFHLDKSTDLRRDEDEDLMKVKKTFICKPAVQVLVFIEMTLQTWRRKRNPDASDPAET
jgi:hypothetical protein